MIITLVWIVLRTLLVYVVYCDVVVIIDRGRVQTSKLGMVYFDEVGNT